LDCNPTVVVVGGDDDAGLATVADLSQPLSRTMGAVVVGGSMKTKKIVPCDDRPQISSSITDRHVAVGGERSSTTGGGSCDDGPRSLIAAESTAAVDC